MEEIMKKHQNADEQSCHGPFCYQTEMAHILPIWILDRFLPLTLPTLLVAHCILFGREKENPQQEGG